MLVNLRLRALRADVTRNDQESMMSMHAIALALGLLQAPDPAAVALVDTALARMGGEDAVRAIERVRFEIMTEWQRITFDDRPYTDLPSYERHTDLRDYTIPAWRNTRQFGARTAVDLVSDSVAIRNVGQGWAPLSVAYVDERRELFTYTPDRLMLMLKDAQDLRLLADTMIDDMPHARVAATLEHFPATVLLRRADGLPAALFFRAGHPNDFGLGPWGEMDVEVWYAQWRPLQNGVHIPGQWNIRRVGRPYKRMTVLSATVNPEASADSFAISDSLRVAFMTTANRPMHDLAVDSARITDQRIVQFFTFGGPAGAVRVGTDWLVLDPGAHALNLERGLEWLGKNVEGRVVGAVVGRPFQGNGAVSKLAADRLPILVGPGSEPFVRIMLRNHGRSADMIDVVREPRTLRMGSDSAILDVIDLPDARGSLLVYVPSLSWIYCSSVVTPLDANLVVAHARKRGWRFDRLGTARGLVQPIS